MRGDAQVTTFDELVAYCRVIRHRKNHSPDINPNGEFLALAGRASSASKKLLNAENLTGQRASNQRYSLLLRLRNINSSPTPHFLYQIMYSNSSSFLGGGSSARPGQSQFGQASQYGASYGQPPPGGMSTQPTGYGGPGLQPQYTGFVPQGQNSYPTQPQQQQPPVGPAGYGLQQFQGQNLPQQPQQPQHQLQQALPTGQPLPQPALPQRTGQTSSEIAQSFRGPTSLAPPAAKPTKTGSKIPTIRLSFITVQDQAKFEQLFKSAVGDGQALSGEQASKFRVMTLADRLQVKRHETCCCDRSFLVMCFRRYGKIIED